MLFRIPSGRLPRFARNDISTSCGREPYQKKTRKILYVNLKENRLKYQYNSFVNFNQLLSYIPKSTALYFHIICTCIYIY